MLSKKVQEVATAIGMYYLKKHNNDYAKTADELYRLRLQEILVVNDVVIIKTERPSLLIGRKGNNIDELSEFLGAKIHIIEVNENELNSFLIPQDESAFDYFEENPPYPYTDEYDYPDDIPW